MIFPRHTFYIYLLDKSYHTVKEKQHTTLLIKDIRGRRLLIQTKKRGEVVLAQRTLRNKAACDCSGSPPEFLHRAWTQRVLVAEMLTSASQILLASSRPAPHCSVMADIRKLNLKAAPVNLLSRAGPSASPCLQPHSSLPRLSVCLSSPRWDPTVPRLVGAFPNT